MNIDQALIPLLDIIKAAPVVDYRSMPIDEARAEPFRDKLRAAGYYAEWKSRIGDEAWAILERYTGKLG